MNAKIKLSNINSIEVFSQKEGITKKSILFAEKMTAINSIKCSVTIVLVLCSVFHPTNGYYSNYASTVDTLRAQYIELEAELWSIVENGVDQSSVLSQINRRHKAFIEDNLTRIDQDENDFFLFEKIYEWNQLKQNFMPIRSLFDTLLPVLMKNADKFDRLELTDFAYTVFSEAEHINQTLEDIEGYMVKQGTYYKVMLVRKS